MVQDISNPEAKYELSSFRPATKAELGVHSRSNAPHLDFFFLRIIDLAKFEDSFHFGFT